jgi:PAS domain S-box-containing protein
VFPGPKYVKISFTYAKVYICRISKEIDQFGVLSSSAGYGRPVMIEDLDRAEEAGRPEESEYSKLWEKLVKSKREFRLIYDAITDLMTVQDTDYRILSYNRAVEEKFGKGLEGKICYEVYQGRDEICPGCPTKKAIETKKPAFSFQTGHEIPDPVEIYAYPVFDEKGEVFAVIEHGVDVSERIKTEGALRESEEKLRATFDAIDDVITIQDKALNILWTNEATKLRFGDVEGRKCYKTYKREERPCTKCVIKETFADGKVHNSEEEGRLKDGTSWNYLVTSSPMRDEDGNIFAVVEVFKDVTERKRVEGEIKAALAEKEVLLKEVHHRVKNNMQIISSLLTLQSMQTQNKSVQKMLQDSRDRIGSMALIHEKLYRSRDMTRVDFKDYVKDLADSLMDPYKGRIALKMDVDDVPLGIHLAVPCGLIINELVSNSLKHAFLDEGKGEIEVRLKQSGEMLELAVRDNGIGMPEDLDIKNTVTLGLQLVDTLISQVHGETELNRTDGTEFRIKFKGVK